MPANGESISIPCIPEIRLDISLDLLKRDTSSHSTEIAPKRSKVVHGALIYRHDVSSIVIQMAVILEFLITNVKKNLKGKFLKNLNKFYFF